MEKPSVIQTRNEEVSRLLSQLIKGVTGRILLPLLKDRILFTFSPLLQKLSLGSLLQPLLIFIMWLPRRDKRHLFNLWNQHVDEFINYCFQTHEQMPRAVGY